MRGRGFVDTNIFLYAFSDQDLEKQEIAKKIVLLDTVISVQVVNESCSNFIRKLSFDESMIQAFVESAYDRYTVVDLSKALFLTASMIRSKYRYSYYDSLIISAALKSGCTILYSEDMQHNQSIGNTLTIVNPFKK